MSRSILTRLTGWRWAGHAVTGGPAATGNPTNPQGAEYAPAPTVRIDPRRRGLQELGDRAAQRMMRQGFGIKYGPSHEKVIASYPTTHSVMVFDAPTGEVKRPIDCRALGRHYPCGIALLPGGRRYAVAGYDTNLHVFERGTHRLQHRLSHAIRNTGHSHIVAD